MNVAQVAPRVAPRVADTAPLPHEQCYRAVCSRDARFDGWFVTAVHTTGIYCRPSCPAVTPKASNVSFFATAAAAQQRGFRACKRCRPDASPGSPAWNVRADAVARAMRLIADGVVDRDGVAGLAQRLGYSERHLNRMMTGELGAGPLAVARAQRAQTARVLLETTAMSITDVAFAAGFASVRQFNDTIREVFDTTPTVLRSAKRRGIESPPGAVSLRLPVRGPFHAASLFGFLAMRVIAGVESWDGHTYVRSMRLPHGHGVVALSPVVAGSAGADPRGPAADRSGPSYVECTLRLSAVADLPTAVQRCRRLLDLDADPVAIDDQLAADGALAELVRARPGLRSPGAVDATEMVVRAVIGQQISVAGARTIASRLVAAVGEPLSVTGASGAASGDAASAVTHVFPSAAALASIDPATLAMPTARRRTLLAACSALAEGTLVLDVGVDRAAAVDELQRIPGIGPWTGSYVAMRALGDPDVFLPTDLGVRRSLERLGVGSSPAAAVARAEAWRPFRSYALHHLWAAS